MSWTRAWVLLFLIAVGFAGCGSVQSWESAFCPRQIPTSAPTESEDQDAPPSDSAAEPPIEPDTPASTQPTDEQPPDIDGAAPDENPVPPPRTFCRVQGSAEMVVSVSSSELGFSSTYERSLTTFCAEPVSEGSLVVVGRAHRSYSYYSERTVPLRMCLRTLDGGAVSDDVDVSGSVEPTADGWVVHLTTPAGAFERVERERCTFGPDGMVFEELYRHGPGSLMLEFDVTLTLPSDCRLDQREILPLPDFVFGTHYRRVVVEPLPAGTPEPCTPPAEP